MIDIIIIAGSLFVAYLTGQWMEKNHYKSIREREKALINVPVVTQPWKKVRQYDDREIAKTGLVLGQVVMGVDSFRVFLGAILSIFGGRIRPYESMMDRARREAILRAREKAATADMLVNMKVETSVISRGAVEVTVYATAVKFA